MTKKRRGGSSSGALATGQLWKLNHLYIQIVALGNRFIEYRMLSDQKESGARIKTSGADVMWEYLKSRRAQLIQSGFSD
jgi:hypothetical protein